MSAQTALLRTVSASFARAIVREERPPLDVDIACAEHDAYRRHLEGAGYDIEVVPADEAHPDCVFIEDTAVILGSVAVVTRSGAASRRGETAPVAQALSSRFPITEIAGPGTLDGGDVFIMGEVVYVGRSARTNSDGIDQLRAVAFHQGLRLVPVGVHDALHLKSAVLPIDPETVVVTPGAVDEERLGGLHVVYEADSERHEFSGLPLHDGAVLVTAGAPSTAESISGLGLEVIPLDVSQIQAADGGLTCMSILF